MPSFLYVWLFLHCHPYRLQFIVNFYSFYPQLKKGMLTNKELLLYCDDLHTTKGSVSQLQLAINGIITASPSPSDYKKIQEAVGTVSSNNALIERTRNLLYSPQARVGVRLKQLYGSDRLPIFTLINKANFKSFEGDKYVGYIVDHTPPKPDHDTLSLINPQHHEDVLPDTYPPSLPPLDEPLLNTVLTDKSFRQPSDFIQLMSFQQYSLQHNAKLALKGRKILESILLEILDEKFPLLHEDDLASLAFKLINESILVKFAIGYNLVRELKSLASKDGLTVKEKAGLISRAFLAYIGAMSSRSSSVHSYSHEEIKIWVLALYKPIIHEWYEHMNKNGKLFQFEQIAKSELRLLLGVEPDELKYDLVETDPVYVVDVKFKDQTLGTGTSLKLGPDAEIKAAVAALSKKESLIQLLRVEKRIVEEDVVPEKEHDHKNESDVDIEENTNPVELHAISSDFVTSPTVAKKTLSNILKKYNLVPIYKYSKVGSHHISTILVDDISIGQGRDVSKKIAAQKAATFALANTELVKFLASKTQHGTEIEPVSKVQSGDQSHDTGVSTDNSAVPDDGNSEQSVKINNDSDHATQNIGFLDHIAGNNVYVDQPVQNISYSDQLIPHSVPQIPTFNYQQVPIQNHQNQPPYGFSDVSGPPSTLPKLPPVPARNSLLSPKLKNPSTLPNIPKMGS